MMYKFAIYDDNDNVIAWGETTTPPEHINTDLGRVEAIDNFDDFVEAVVDESSD